MARWQVRNASGDTLETEPGTNVGPYYVVFGDNIDDKHGPYMNWDEAVTKRNQLRGPLGGGFHPDRGGNEIA